MTNAIISVMAEDRRTIRIPDSEWEAASRAAHASGENISDRIRRLLREASLNDPNNVQTEYRATLLEPVENSDDPVVVHVRQPITEVDVRKLFPRRLWNLEAREVSPWHPASKRPLSSNRGD